MIKTEINKDFTVVTESNWDSSIHCGFITNVVKDGEYFGKTLDKVLTDNQIKSIELMINVMVKGFLTEENDCE
ncbi:hypothetical protein [Pseudoalteromonas phage PH357]|nr:hypothetical protein [Pseudoalteromonas phage PH357]